MSITPNDPANFSPTLQGYTGQGSFRFWCQTVLPLVYDDSLSYYELLNKVVNYLNNVISDVSTVESNVGEIVGSFDDLQNYVNENYEQLVETYNTLEQYVNDYFTNLDIQQEINSKLDQMASSGALSVLLAPFIPDLVTDWMDEHITPTTPVVDNSLTISGAAADAKVTGDEITILKDDITANLAYYNKEMPVLAWEQGSINATTGNNSSSNTRIRCGSVDVKGATKVTVPSGKKISYRLYSSTNVFEYASVFFTDDFTINFSENKKIRFIMAFADDADITPSEGSDIYTVFSTDKYLNKKGTVADSKTVGDKIERLTSEFIITNGYQSGGYRITDGAKITGTQYVRTEFKVPANPGDYVKCNSANIVYRVLAYQKVNNEYVYTGVIKDFADTNIALIEEFCYITITARYDDNREITSDSFDTVMNQVNFIKLANVKTYIFDPMEIGSLGTSAGNLSNSSNRLYHRSTKFYEFEQNNIVKLIFSENDASNIENVLLLRYDSSFNLLGYATLSLHGNQEISWTLTGEATRYIAICVRHIEDQANFEGVTLITNTNSPALYYPNIINPNNTSLAFNYEVQNGICASGRLLLPPNYTISGKKVPLVVFVHGSGSITTWTTNLSSDYFDYFSYITNEGYALFDCYPWTDKESLGSTYSPITIPVNINSYLKGIEYVCSRFNIDRDSVVLACKSQGGNIGHWAIVETDFPFKGVGLFAPTTDPILQKTNNLFYNKNCRLAISKYVNFSGSQTEIDAFVNSGNVTNGDVISFLNKNKGKITSMYPVSQGIIGTDSETLFEGGIDTLSSVPQWMLDAGLPERQTAYDLIPAIASHDEYIKIAKRPVKFWCAFDDESTSSYGNYAVHQWLLNGGSDSEFRILPIGTGGHHAMDTDSNALKSSGTTSLGIPYTNIPTAYVELVEFFNYCLTK